ncbi:hypothetical protein KUCAC02_031630, partial [Chaenocephalus aceratus]
RINHCSERFYIMALPFHTPLSNLFVNTLQGELSNVSSRVEYISQHRPPCYTSEEETDFSELFSLSAKRRSARRPEAV